jgi:multiphosphoryl transfer protein
VVGIVVVSHSDALAEAAVTLARQMGGEELALEPAGGTDEPGVLGTDPVRIQAAIERAMSDDGVLVMMDLGSALMSAEFAVELLGDAGGRVLLSEAALIEGTVAAAVAARGGASLDEVAAEARGALAMKASQLGVSADALASGPALGDEGPGPGNPDAERELLIRNPIGLHARPAALLIEVARSFDAEVWVSKVGGGGPVRARSLTNVLALGARLGDRLVVSASGPEAQDAVRALIELADSGFGEGVVAVADSTPAPAAVASAEVAPPAVGEVLVGVPASAGIAVGPARLLHRIAGAPPDRPSEGSATERAHLEQALVSARKAVVADREAVAARAGAGDAAIFDAHLALLDDEALLEPAWSAIDGGATAERAFYDAAQLVAARYRELDEPLLRERAIDVLDVGRRAVRELIGDQGGGFDAAGIVVAGELTPADAAQLDPEAVLGIATAHGTATAHAAILSRALGLPAVVGLGEAVLAVADGTRLLLDGGEGRVQVDPPAEVVREALAARERGEERRRVARARSGELGATRDGRRVEVFANLGSESEAARAVELGAEGVGLLRTEFLFLGRAELPDEEEQAETLRAIARALDGRPLIVRTLDAGADKPLPSLPMPPETNPFLGVRGIRLALLRPDVLATQLRAILRAASDYDVKVMLPMVSTLDELRAARAELDRARADTGIDAPLELGIMVEVPAAALTAARLAEEADFFSLGTNDLTQYTMAAERGDERLAPLLTGPQPAVLRLVRETVQAAAHRGRMVGVCGELAGDPPAAILLAGLGVTELSMAPALVPEAKAALREVDFATAQAAAEGALEAPDAAAARAIAAALL